MTYNSKIDQSRIRAYNHAIATKILDLMEKLRLDQNENSARRWIWELIQNAKDVAHENNDISIEINFQDNGQNGLLEFKHNGKPFSVDNLTFLIEQVSTKERSPEKIAIVKTTGKFGTGFLTTHLLSEIVEVEGVIKEADEPYRKFEVLLDRSSRDIEGIIESVSNSLASLGEIDQSQSYTEFLPENLNTIFRYYLDESGIKVARIGLNDLQKSLIYTLVFLPGIKSVKVVDNLEEYEVLQDVSKEGDCINIYTVVKNTPNERIETKIAMLTNNNTSIAVEIEYKNDQIFLKEIDPLVPRLFCDFPLVGTEEFPFPVIINSSGFNPNEPRNGVYLTEKSDTKIVENRSILMEATELYFALLEHSSKYNWGNIYLLAKIPRIVGNEWLSKEWMEKSILEPIREKLIKTPIVDTENHGRLSIVDKNNNPIIWFPYSSKNLVRSRIWDLANSWIPSMIPRKADIDIWYDIIWSQCSQLSLKKITLEIQQRKGLGYLAEMLVEQTNPTEWINEYFEVLDLDDDIIYEVISDKYIVIPNQNGMFRGKSSLRIDDNIDEELKNVLTILHEDCREYLINSDVKTGQIEFPVANQEEIIEKINKIISSDANNKIDQACDYIVTLFSDSEDFPEERDMIYQFCKRVSPENIGVKKELRKWKMDIWKEVDKRKIKRIAESISVAKNLATLINDFCFENDQQAVEWLDSFVSYATNHGFDHYLNLKSMPLLPNQNGDFMIKDDLFLDNGEIDEVLKDISLDLGYDFRSELLDLNIYLELPQNRTKSQKNVAEEIVRLITPKLVELPRTDETKFLCKRLYLWFNKNKEKAKTIFGEFYSNKHFLYDDDEIAETLQKAEIVSEILEEFDIADISALRQVLKDNQIRELVNLREEITQQTLVSLGVTSIEELEKALEDKDLAAKFTHTSTPSLEMFLYVQNLIARSKANIIKYLNEIPEYDCTELEELSNTVLGGIKKDGLSIHVVVRPSDNGEVIVYYSSEKDTLDYTNSELWIDNGVDEPKHLTLGRILKTTGINRIPV